MALENQKIKTLGDFLKSRRKRLRPADFDLVGHYGRRRTSGLRREEVAYLAGVSTTWYTWLEQGRNVTASREVIESIGKALRLSTEEYMHLLRLAHYDQPVDSPMDIDAMKPALQKMIDQLMYPAMITNSRTEVLAWNRLASEFIVDYNALPPERRVMLQLLFTDSELRKRFVNWEDFAQYAIAAFRLYFDQNAGDPWFEQFVQRLCKESREFTAWWQLHDIQRKNSRLCIIDHPRVGHLSFQLNTFGHINGNMNLHCCMYIPVAGTDTEQRLAYQKAR